jgi:hypothetical protein
MKTNFPYPQVTLSSGQVGFRRAIHPEIKIIDAHKGIVDYVASDETLDSYREVVRANGWKFTHFKKNAPFVDSHDYSCIENQVGKITDFRIEGNKLVERAQWAIDVAENKLASFGFRMTEAGYLKAVSVGFFPKRYVCKWDTSNPDMAKLWAEQLKELGIEENAVGCIYLEQEQIELSACIIGANPNALAKAYKADVLKEADIDWFAQQRAALDAPQIISQEDTERETARATASPALVTWANEQARKGFLEKFSSALNQK